MAITREEKKAEAIRRMKAFRYFSQSIREFSQYGKIMVNEPPVGAHYYVDEDEDLVRKIKELESEHDVVVYAVIRAWTNYGQLDSILYVDNWKEEWPVFDRDLKDGITYTYTYNREEPMFSDYGSIQFVRTAAAGLMRRF